MIVPAGQSPLFSHLLLSLFIFLFSGSKVEGWSLNIYFIRVRLFFSIRAVPRKPRERATKEQSQHVIAVTFTSIERIYHHRSCNHGQRRDHVRQARTDVPRGRANVDEAKLGKPAKHPPKGESRVVGVSSRRIEASPIAFSLAGLIHSFEDSLIVHKVWRGNVRRR